VPGDARAAGGGRCITLAGNCSKLATEAGCALRNTTCAWNQTAGPGPSGGGNGTGCEALGGGGGGRPGGWEFNCSRAAWFGVEPTLPYGDSGLPVGTLGAEASARS
jgi:hypothetical protein